MPTNPQPSPSASTNGHAADPPGKPAKFGLAALNLYNAADRGSETLIFGMVVFSPWAFGCATSQLLVNWNIFGCPQAWNIWVMNFAGYLLGGLLAAKFFFRQFTGYQPPRWTKQMSGRPSPDGRAAGGPAKSATVALAAVTALILIYCLVSAANARSAYRPNLFQFEYFKNYTRWLPHSYDRVSSWTAFWNYLALAFSFWAVRDWLLGKTLTEIRAERNTAGEKFGQVSLLPGRLRRLLWVLSINGALLGVEGIAQWLSGTSKLLWLVQPRINPEAVNHFGTYAYRANAAQYFNLLWPVALGFWWTLRRATQLTAERTGQSKQWTHHLLLPGVMVMAICPIISFSRGGAIFAVAAIALASLILFTALRRAHGATKLGLFLFVLAILCIGFALGGEKLGERMKDFDNGLAGREHINEVAHAMAEEHPLFGTGPGSFNMLFQFYRSSVDEYWPAQLHNDWLETRITFGWLGSALIAAAFLIVATRRWLPGGIQCGWRFTALLWLGLATCLAHARVDFPFQVYSIVFLFLVLCAILFIISRQAGRGR